MLLASAVSRFRGRTGWLGALVVLVGCSEPVAPLPPAPETLATPPHTLAVIPLFEEHCGLCHNPGSDDAVPQALALYNLWDPGFTDHLSDAQLVEGHRRFLEQGLDDDDRARVDAWLQAELVFRDGHPRRYPEEQRRRPALDPVVTPPGGCLGRGCLPVR